MRRKSGTGCPGRAGNLTASSRTRIAPDMELVWYHSEVGAGWSLRRAEVRTERGMKLVAHVDVQGNRYSILSCGLTDAQRKVLKAGLDAFAFEEEEG